MRLAETPRALQLFFVAASAIFGISEARFAFQTLQDKYDLVFTSAKMERANPEFVGPGSFFRVAPKEGGKPAVSAFIPLIQDLPADTNGNYSITDFSIGESPDLPGVVIGTDWKIKNWWASGDTIILHYSLEIKIKRGAQGTATKHPH